MENIFRRIQARLRSRIASFSGKSKIIPYLSETDDIYSSEKSPSNRNIESKGGGFNGINGEAVTNSDPNDITFLASLGIEISVHSTVKSPFNRCHEPTSVAHISLSEFTCHSRYSCLLEFLRMRNLKFHELPSPYPVLDVIIQLKYLLEGIHKLLKESLDPMPLSLGDEIGSILDMTLERLLIVSMQMTFETNVICALTGLFTALHILSPHIEFNDDQTRVVWCQASARASQLLECITSTQTISQTCVNLAAQDSKTIDNNVDPNDKAYEIRVQSISKALQSVSVIVMLMRDIYGLPYAAPPVMAFWTACDTCLNTISESLLTGVLRVAVARMCSSAVYRLLSTTTPSPQELSALIHSPQLKTTPGSASPSHRSHSESQVLKPCTQRQQRKSRGASGLPMWSRLSYVLVGFQFLINGSMCGDFSASTMLSVSHALPRQSEWTAAFHEALMVSLQPTASYKLKCLSSLLGELLFLCLLTVTPHHKQGAAGVQTRLFTPTLDYIFVELAEHLTKFSESWVKKNNFVVRLTQMSTTINSRVTGRPPSTGAHNSCRSLDTSIDMGPTRPRKFSTGSRAYSPHIAARESAAQANGDGVFAVGDNVDALCTVQNGSQRWFPGTVMGRALCAPDIETNTDSKLSVTFTYTILFTDGDTREGVPPSDIRMTKNRSRVSSRISTARVDPSPRLSQDPKDILREFSKVAHKDIGSDRKHSNISKDGEREDDEDKLLERLDRAHANTRSGIAVQVTTPPNATGALTQANAFTPVGSEVSMTFSSPSPTASSIPREVLISQNCTKPNSITSPKSSPIQLTKTRREASFQSVVSIDDNLDASFEDDDDDCNIFQIPLVLSRPSSTDISAERPRGGTPPIIQSQSKSGVVVPRMHLENLDLSSSVDHGAGGSLSGSLLRESSKQNIFEEYADDSRNDLSPRGTVDKLVGDFARDDSSSTLTRVESWRDSAGWSTRRSSGYGLPKSSRLPSYSSSNSLLSLIHMSNSQSSQDALKLIQVAVSDVSKEMTVMNELCCTYEVIVNILIYRALCELPETHTDMQKLIPSSIQVSKSEGIGTPARSMSTPSRVESQVSHEGDIFDDSMGGASSDNLVQELLFGVREYLSLGLSELSPAHMMSTASYIGPTAVRLLKLSSPIFFSVSCLPLHIRENNKISSGAFGSVYKVRCPAECRLALLPGKDKDYAVKRITRERSLHDPPVIFDVFSEVSCLESLSKNKGVCDILNFGIHESEYWIVMEQGKYDLKDWTMRMLVDSHRDLPKDINSAMGVVDEFILFLCVYAECVSIVRSVHAEHIVHYDIKCSNFIVRDEPRLDIMIDAVLKNKLSGRVFLGDFGESLHISGSDFGHSMKTRSRGTLPIQSPEMLCINESCQGIKSKQVRVSTERPTYGCDIWSLGCLLFELSTGRFLFQDMSWTEMFCMLCMERYNPPDISAELTAYGVDVDLPSMGSSLKIISELIDGTLKQIPKHRTALATLESSVHNIIKRLLPYRFANKDLSTQARARPTGAENVDSDTSVSNIFGADELSLGHQSRTTSISSVQQKPQNDTAYTCEGSWLVGSYVSFSIGCMFSVPIAHPSRDDRFESEHQPSMFSPFSGGGVTHSTSWLHQCMRKKLPGISTLDELVSSVDALVASTPDSVQKHGSMAVTRMTVKSIRSAFASSLPPLSYLLMTDRLGRSASLSRLSLDTEYSVTLFEKGSSVYIRNSSDCVSVVRIGRFISRYLSSNDSKEALSNKCTFSRGTYCKAFLSNTQHHCFLHDDMEIDQITRVVVAALRYSLSEIQSGKCVSVCIDPESISGDSASADIGTATSPLCRNPSRRINISLISRLVLTVGIFISCTSQAAAEGFCGIEAERVKVMEDKVSSLIRRRFPWVVSLIDIDLFSKLCGAVFDFDSSVTTFVSKENHSSVVCYTFD